MMNSLTVVALMVTLAISSASAQQLLDPPRDSAPRLSVRPHKMATGTRTVQAGLTSMDSLPGYYVYVPAKAVGTRRVPLVVLLPGGERTASMEMPKFRALADKYGMIVLSPTASIPGRWDVIDGFQLSQTESMDTETGLKVSVFPESDVRKIDAAMKEVLRTHAIDPDRIALLGFSDGGSYSLFLGRSNLDVFSRIAALSALTPFDGTKGPSNSKTQFLLSGGIAEGMVPQTLKLAQVLRQDGHSVKTLLGLRGHMDYVADEDFVWQWLIQSWEDPSITTRTAVVDSDPVLTIDALARLKTFWIRFMQEPDSIRDDGRMAHQEQRSLALGTQPVSIITMNIPVMAATYPSIAADLETAGLTAKQAAAYRTALFRAQFTLMGFATGEGETRPTIGLKIPFGTVVPTSVLGQNMAFMKAHDAELQSLVELGMLVVQ